MTEPLRETLPLLTALVLGAALGPGVAISQPQPAIEEIEFDDTVPLLDSAEAILESAEPARAVPLLSRVVRVLERRLESGDPRPEDSSRLQRALALRARASFESGEAEAAGRDIARLLAADPSFRPDPERASPSFVTFFDRRRSVLVGEVALRVTPPDARVRIGDRVLEAGATSAEAPAGVHPVQVERPGFATHTAELRVVAGRRVTLEAELERVGAVLFVTTSPPGAEVAVDDRPVGTTQPDPAAPDVSLPLVVDGIAPGAHLLGLRKEGYRDRRVQVAVERQADYTVPPIELEPARGRLALSGLSPSARLFVDGDDRTASVRDGVLDLLPGEHRLSVQLGTLGRFERPIAVADRERLEVAVELEPSLALVGVLGEPSGPVVEARERLATALQALDGWVFLERSGPGAEILTSGGVGTLRGARVLNDDETRTSIDWETLREELDRRIGASLYLLGVLPPGAREPTPDLWLWAAGPGPAEPRRWPGDADGGEALESLLQLLRGPLELVAPWVGVRFIDSPLAGAPVVAEVTAGGPAAEAGLQPGDAVRRGAGEPVGSRRELIALLAEVGAGGRVELEIERGDEARAVPLTLGRSPLMPWPGEPRSFPPVARAALRLAIETGGSGAPRWVLDLCWAAMLLREESWPEAARVLRGIEAPAGSGLGGGTVDYWLGVALAEDPAADPEEAEAALRRAAAAEGASLHSHDGPPVAPRARARLAAGSASP